MQHADDTVQVRPIPILTPPGRPLEVGWGQEFARWIWHLFVLPQELARPWPRWIHRYLKPPLMALAKQLGVSNPLSVRSWALHLILINPPRLRWWSNPVEYQHARRRRAPLFGALIQHLAVPYLGPLIYGIAARIEVYSGIISRAFARYPLLVRVGIVLGVLVLLVLSATTPLSMGQQCI